MMTYVKNSRGFTLVEMIISVGLVSILLLVTIQTSLTVASIHRQSRTYLDVNSSAINAFSRFSRDTRRASLVDTVQSTLGASSGKLVLNMKKVDGSYDTTTFALASGTVQSFYNGAYTGDLTPININVSNLTFRRFFTGSTTAIRIEMTVAPDASSTVSALNFYGTYVLRGSYSQ
jgi:prepilin-type N-terminal cleavage/methylation domain-containing protein